MKIFRIVFAFLIVVLLLICGLSSCADNGELSNSEMNGSQSDNSNNDGSDSQDDDLQPLDRFADGTMIYNPTVYTVWFTADNVLYSIKPGETLVITD